MANYVDYQQRAKAFFVGAKVYPFILGHSDMVGRVVQVFPAIGMVDVEWPHGSQRMAVEELQIINSLQEPPSVETSNVPGGAGTVPVSSGPVADPVMARKAATVDKVAANYVRQAMYWGASNRHYKATAEELLSGKFFCPRCKDSLLRGANYKKDGERSERLLACPKCLFLIKRSDIIGHPEYQEDLGSLRVGTCSACFHEVDTFSDTSMIKPHEHPSTGGVCPGAGFPPFEKSTEGTSLYLKKYLLPELDSALLEVERTKNRKEPFLGRKIHEKDILPGTPEFDLKLASLVKKAQSKVESVKSKIAFTKQALGLFSDKKDV